MKERLYRVCSSRKWGNKLMFNKKTQEYIYFHYDVEIWRMKGDEELYIQISHAQTLMNTSGHMNEGDNLIRKIENESEIMQKYKASCEKFCIKEMPDLSRFRRVN